MRRTRYLSSHYRKSEVGAILLILIMCVLEDLAPTHNAEHRENSVRGTCYSWGILRVVTCVRYLIYTLTTHDHVSTAW
jgi:hypothetical protein